MNPSPDSSVPCPCSGSLKNHPRISHGTRHDLVLPSLFASPAPLPEGCIRCRIASLRRRGATESPYIENCLARPVSRLWRLPFEPPRDGVRGKLYMNRLKTSSLFLKKMQIFVKKRQKKPIFCSFEPSNAAKRAIQLPFTAQRSAACASARGKQQERTPTGCPCESNPSRPL